MSIQGSATIRMALSLVLFLFMAVPAQSQELDDRLVAMAGSRAEFDAAEAIDAETSPVNRLTMTDDFLTEYPDSELAHQILLTRLQTYVDLKNNQGILTAGQAYVDSENAFFESKTSEIDDPDNTSGYAQFGVDHFTNLTFAYQSLMNASSGLNRPDDTAMYAELALAASDDAWNIQAQALEQGSPEYQAAEQRHQQTQLFFTQTVMTTYQNANNSEKTIEYAERALRLNPEDLATLLTISTVMAERPPADASLREDHFRSALEYGQKALEVLESFLEAAGGQIGPQQRAGLLSGAHMTLGTIYLNQEEWNDAQDEFEEALESSPSDATAYLRLGMAYARDEDVDGALESLARSVYLNGPAQARDLLEQIYEAANGDLTGLDAFIQEQGAEIE